MTTRRHILIALGASALSLPSISFGQQPRKIPRIGLLRIRANENGSGLAKLRQELRALGYVDGANIVIDTRFMVARYDQLREAADGLVAEKVDVIAAEGATATEAARKATSTIPVVIRTSADPVKLGVVASLAKPGGNVTGVTLISKDINGKRLQLLKETVPTMRRVGVLLHANSKAEAESLKDFEAVARDLNLEAQAVEVTGMSAIESVLSGIRRSGVDGIAVVTSSMLATNAKQVIAAITKVRLPTIYPVDSFVEAGGLLSYGPSRSESLQQVAVYIDKVLKGAKPADLPIVQPSKFDLLVNLKAAKTIGITIPQSVLLRADRVIE